MPAPRKPTAVLEASGATKLNPARYADRALEPKPDPGISVKPSFLSPIADKHWDEFVALLSKSRVICENDVISMAMLCEAFAEWREATDTLRKDKSRLPSAHRRYNSAFDKLLKIQQDFGMTPASRSRVQVTSKPADQNKFGAMASKRGQPYKEPA